MYFKHWLRRTAAGLALLLALLGQGCQSKVAVPAAITTRITPEHRRIPGTHVLLAAPSAFKLNAAKHLLRLDELQYAQVVELPGVTFSDYLAQLRREMATVEELPADALHETTFNGHPAVFLTQPYRNLPGMEAALLAFGDTSQVTLLVGVYPAILPSSRKLIQDILLTACYDAKLRVPADEVAGFQADMLDTDFGRLTQDGRWTLYGPRQQPAGVDAEHGTIFRVMVLPPISQQTQVQDLALALMREYRTAGEVDNVQEINTNVAGNYAYENVLTYHYKGRQGKALVLLISTPTGVIVFDGRAYAQADKRVEQFGRLARAIRLQEPAS